MRLKGRFSTVVKRNRWPEALALASQRFGQDWQAANNGDTEATFVVDLVERRCDQEDFAHFLLWSVHGVSFSEQHSRGWGSTAAISAAVRRCSETVHAVYSGSEKQSMSRVLLEQMAMLSVLRDGRN